MVLRWHHITGVIFGVFALTFVFSGMMSLVDIPSWMQKGKTRNREVRFRGREGGMLAADLYALDYRKIVDSLSDVKSTSGHLWKISLLCREFGQ